MLHLGVSLQPRWPIDDATSVLRAARRAEELGFDHVAIGNRLLDSGFGLDADPLRWAVHGVARGAPGRASGDPGGPPLWIGGHSDAALRRALRFGAGWYGTGADAADVVDVRRRLRALAADPAAADRLTLASAQFLTPPDIPAVVSAPGRPLGGDAPNAASVAEDLRRLGDAGLTTCTLWLPVAAEHLEPAMEWIATEVMPRLPRGSDS